MNVELLGLIAAGITTIYTMFGVPSQVIKSYKRKSTEGLSFASIGTLFLGFVAWVLYALSMTEMNYYILIPNALGALGNAVILLQMISYKSH